MTAPQAHADARWMERVAAALNNTATGIYMGSGWSETIAPALLPVLTAYGDERAAQALDEAGDEIRTRLGWAGGYGKALRARAAALLASTDTEGANDDGRC